MTAQNKRKLENLENAQIWHAWLGHISQDRMKRLVDSKSLEINNLDNLPACESCLKGKMTKKPFVGQSKLANGLFDLIHTDVCGPLNTQARGGFSYFITFTDGHSRYGYVYLMRYKSEAFVRFKEFRLEVENQTGCKIKTLRSGRGGEYLSGEFIDYLKENGIVSQWTPPGTPQLNGVAKRRNRTLLDMIRSMMSFTELPLSFWGYALETAARVPQPPERYGFLGVTDQLDNDPKTYKEAMSDIDSRKWLEDMKSKMDSVSSNQVWTLVDRPKGVRPIGCKWVYKRKIGADGEVNTFKARLVAKGYTQRPGVDFEETFSPVAMAKSIRIILTIAAWYDYEIWQMDVKTAFLNGFVEEEIYMDQLEGFTVVGEEQKVCHLQRSIYGLKQASRS
ncbi:Retrovirus-related Pol polyprotein from transposon RE2 [Sesamum angolense]|uniref:Retrovirus-related Pol polyprotein from transposon RE2 n=1 Tax=Sesamum angolense TaxID=2727404 RepID=A0AAE1T4E9_9LAMI|nr:Retrovirus-related Pol polyprotein from transposon RE2 [Sesamum angolense]